MHRAGGSLAAIGGLCACLALSAPAAAQDYWTGPYVGALAGYAWGDATYTFNTDGSYNTAAGQTFGHDVAGVPIGGFLGYAWRSGNIVYGFEASFTSAFLGVSNYDVPSPYDPNDQFDLKGHWFAALTPRIGYAMGRVLLYAEAGPAIGHLVARVEDTAAGTSIWSAGSAIGLAAGVGVEVAATRWLSIGLGYQYLTLAPMNVPGRASLSVGSSTTDHDIRYRSHSVFGRVVFHMDPGREIADGQPVDPYWGGFYVGTFGSSLWQAGLALGYDVPVGTQYLAGVEVQAATDLRLRGYSVDINGRFGYLHGDVLFYAEAGIGYADGPANGTFFGLIDGGYYTLGGGIEVALRPRTSGVFEIEAIGGLGAGITDANFQAGLNVRFR